MHDFLFNTKIVSSFQGDRSGYEKKINVKGMRLTERSPLELFS
ncbi:hypothetical protein [Okeania sp. SIO3B5]|nr:hypothetical protein [Okeania sp. SIO3B5]